MRGKRHSDEVRAAVMAALLAGQSVTEVARQYKLDNSIVSRWKSKLSAPELHRIAERKGDEFAELLTRFLREIITTLTVQVRFTRRTKWLQNQAAAEVATLFGVTADKAIRLLEAVQLAEDARGPAAPDAQVETPPGPTD